MRVAVFRTRDDGERTAALLAGRGHEALLAPVLEIAPVPHTAPAQRFDAIIFTSAHGAEALDPATVEILRHLPCFCVGGRTARTASDRGFTDVRNARADAAALASLIDETMPGGSALLFVTGRHRKTEVDRRLSALGHGVTVAEVYDAQAVPRWSPEILAAFRGGTVDAALHYSHRSADLALTNARQGAVASAFMALHHHCLSRDAAAPLCSAGCTQVVVAAEPNEESLLGTIPVSYSATLKGRAGR